MPRARFPAVAVLCTAAVLCAAPLSAAAVDAAAAGRAPTPPDQPRPRTGDYKVVTRGAKVIHAKCVEGGNVVVPTHGRSSAVQRERKLRDACKTVDYTK